MEMVPAGPEVCHPRFGADLSQHSQSTPPRLSCEICAATFSPCRPCENCAADPTHPALQTLSTPRWPCENCAANTIPLTLRNKCFQSHPAGPAKNVLPPPHRWPCDNCDANPTPLASRKLCCQANPAGLAKTLLPNQCLLESSCLAANKGCRRKR